MDIYSYQKSRNNFQILVSIFSPTITKRHIFLFMPYSKRVNSLGSDVNQEFFFSFIEAQLLTCCVRMTKLSDLSELQFCHY